MGLDLVHDYGPDKALANAAREAGIAGMVFPWKTVMWIKADEVKVAYGYRAAPEVIYAAASR